MIKYVNKDVIEQLKKEGKKLIVLKHLDANVNTNWEKVSIDEKVDYSIYNDVVLAVGI